MNVLFYFAIIALIFASKANSTTKLQEVFSWTSLDYQYQSTNDKIRAILTRKFIPENNLPVGIEIWKNKLFITVPRWRTGIPSTLNYVNLENWHVRSPQLIPYPDWESNELGNCDSGLSTVYRIKADSCDRLWVLDTGTFGIGNTTQNPCPYALNVFDLITNKRIRRYELQTSDTNSNTFIANIAVELGETCEDAFAYMSDELGYGLIVYSWEQNRSWRFSHSYFMPDPLAGDFNIDGLNFQWGEEGIFGMSLSPRQSNGEIVLFFSPLASNRQFAVSTNILKDMSKVDSSYHDFVALRDRGPNSHTTARVMDELGIEYFNLIDRNAVGCWNSRTKYGAENIGVLDIDDEKLVFPSDIKVDEIGNVWVISDKMSTFLLSNLNYSDVNFRVLFAPKDMLIANTVCDSNLYLSYHHNYN